MSATAHETATLRLLLELESLRRLVRLYPAGHPAIPSAQLRVQRAAEAMGVPAASLAFGPDAIFLDQEELQIPKASPVVRLRQLLCRLGLAAIHLTFPDAREGLPHFAARLAQLHDPPGEDDREALLADATAFPGIELVALDLSRVQLVEGGEAVPEEKLALPVWAELARGLGRDGAFVLADKILDGEMTAALLAELVSQSADPATLFDQIFRRLAELVAAMEPSRRRLALRQLAVFLAEWFALLAPERRHLAVVAASTHFPPALESRDGEEERVVELETFLEAVAYFLEERLPVPEPVQRTLARLAELEPDQVEGVSAAVIARAQALLVRISLLGVQETTPKPPPPPPTLAPPSAYRTALAAYGESLAEDQLRRQLVGILGEVMTLWPEDTAAQRGSLRLAEELVESLEAGDLDSAARIATILSATRFDEAKKLVCDAGVMAAVRAFATTDRSDHARIAAILLTLGEEAIPAILEALANEENLSTRKRLMEVVLHHGERALPYVRSRLHDPRWYVVRNAVFLLRHLGDRASTGVFKSLLPTAKPQVVSEILKALVALEDPQWLNVLLRELARAQDEERRLVVLGVAARIHHPAVVRALTEQLHQQSGKRLREPYTIELIRALGRLADPAAVGELARILELPRWRVGEALSELRREAALALVRIDSEEARTLVSRLASDRDPAVAAAVRRALRTPAPVEESA
ncbi:MAG: HEAT repeat domain-containing protein [Thermoanaerobaculaceae bacterium]|nr:HEAT repeat domain-containing protein [Thermoanaerobaculaceae bacterium]